MKVKYFAIVFLFISLLFLLIPGCTQSNNTNTIAPSPTTKTIQPTTTTTTPPTTTPTPQVVEKDKSYNVVSPRGVALPVNIKPLAKRLDTLDGKTIYVDQAEADPVIMPALWARVQKDYPNTNWKLILPTSLFGPSMPEAEVKTNAQAVIRGVGW